MTGHESILKLRRSGRKFAYVWVSDFPHCTMDGWTVRVAGDNPELLDLRFLVGSTVIVEGADAARVNRIAASCRPLAQRVIASTFDGRRVTKVTDSDGVLTWPN